MAYARPVYFFVTASLAQLLVRLIGWLDGPLSMYGFELISIQSLAVALELSRLVILFMPIAFAMGFYSQLKTFLNFLLEQIEYHCFGGSGQGSAIFKN